VKATAEELANKMKPSRRFKRRDVALSPYIAKQNALDFQERSINRNKKADRNKIAKDEKHYPTPRTPLIKINKKICETIFQKE
jgi:hypothetical protein